MMWCFETFSFALDVIEVFRLEVLSSSFLRNFRIQKFVRVKYKMLMNFKHFFIVKARKSGVVLCSNS